MSDTTVLVDSDGNLFVNGQKIEGIDTSEGVHVETINGVTTVNGQPIPPGSAGGQNQDQASSAAQADQTGTSGIEIGQEGSVVQVGRADASAALDTVSDDADTAALSADTQDRAAVATPDAAGPGEAIAWNVLAAEVQANFAATGQWFLGPDTAQASSIPDSGEPDWNALAAEVQANFAATGQWFLA